MSIRVKWIRRNRKLTTRKYAVEITASGSVYQRDLFGSLHRLDGDGLGTIYRFTTLDGGDFWIVMDHRGKPRCYDQTQEKKRDRYVKRLDRIEDRRMKRAERRKK